MKKIINEIYQKKEFFNSLKGRGVKNFLGSFAKTPFHPSGHACKIERFRERGEHGRKETNIKRVESVEGNGSALPDEGGSSIPKNY